MLITVVGNDFPKKSKKIKEFFAGLKLKRPNAIIQHFDFLDLTEKNFNEALETIGGLFEEKNIFYFSNIFRDKELKKKFLNNLDKISKSKNAFILNEDFVSEIEFKKLKDVSYKIEHFTLLKKEFNIFEISNAFSEKNKKELWIKYHKALDSNIFPEQIYSNIFFALKNLNLVAKFSEKESGLKPFPYKKATQSLKKWSEDNLEEKLFNFISLYNNSRISGLDLKQNLEKFILEL